MDFNLELDERAGSVIYNSKLETKKIDCDQDSVAGSVSQRACVYSGARVVLNPITDAYHIVHGPIGCASYTWDIRGSLSSGAEVFRTSFSTDLREEDIVFGGEKKLSAAIEEIVEEYEPGLIFIYSTCVVGVIGDDLKAIAKQAEQKYGIVVIPVQSSGFAGNKTDGYKAAGSALLELMNRAEPVEKKQGINILGDFNLAGEMWILEDYLQELGIEVVAKFTGDATYQELEKAPGAELNIVQCAGSMVNLAKKMKHRYGIPLIRISFYGLEDIENSLLAIAEQLSRPGLKAKVKEFVEGKKEEIAEELDYYRQRLEGKSAAIYVGGGFKAISLIKQFNSLGMRTVMVGTQSGRPEEYVEMRRLTDEGTVILDDSNPIELEKFIKEQGADILVGGTKERPLAYKLGVAFCDHNHARKHPLSGFIGALNFAAEIDASINSPVWKFLNRKQGVDDE